MSQAQSRSGYEFVAREAPFAARTNRAFLFRTSALTANQLPLRNGARVAPVNQGLRPPRQVPVGLRPQSVRDHPLGGRAAYAELGQLAAPPRAHEPGGDQGVGLGRGPPGLAGPGGALVQPQLAVGDGGEDRVPPVHVLRAVRAGHVVLRGGRRVGDKVGRGVRGVTSDLVLLSSQPMCLRSGMALEAS